MLQTFHGRTQTVRDKRLIWWRREAPIKSVWVAFSKQRTGILLLLKVQLPFWGWTWPQMTVHWWDAESVTLQGRLQQSQMDFSLSVSRHTVIYLTIQWYYNFLTTTDSFVTQVDPSYIIYLVEQAGTRDYPLYNFTRHAVSKPFFIRYRDIILLLSCTFLQLLITHYPITRPQDVIRKSMHWLLDLLLLAFVCY